ncbi:MAG: DUF692 family protein [Candidatus Thiodiazotropha sp. (ex Ustalcina ferruginea)]|nr:DUF692 family protein [Candidatus Thiodiazotropha sp. (ex Ustalcina ferruginea)]
MKSQHYQSIIDQQPDIGWFEVHPENYMEKVALHYATLNVFAVTTHSRYTA